MLLSPVFVTRSLNLHNMKTEFQTKEEAEKGRQWWVVDADGEVVGRLATQIASILRGKHKPTFTPHNDGGDFVVVINADKVRFTGRKLEQKSYYHHTGYIGGLKELNAGKVFASKPETVIEHAVRGMLPKGPLGRKQLSKLKIYKGGDHPHVAQCPRTLCGSFPSA